MQSTQNPHLLRIEDARGWTLHVICNNLYVTFKTYIFNTGWGTAKFIFKSTFHFISRMISEVNSRGQRSLPVYPVALNRLLTDLCPIFFICWYLNADLFQNRNWDKMALPGAQFIFIVLVHDVVTHTQRVEDGTPSLPESRNPIHLHHNQHHHRFKIMISDHNDLLLQLITFFIKYNKNH